VHGSPIQKAGNMVRIDITSERLKSVGYDAKQQVLEIEFLTEGIIQYFKVPEKAYAGLLNAKSNEGYYINKIKYIYPYKRVD
jgi:KTSC domain